jgi:hypothetical protein
MNIEKLIEKLCKYRHEDNESGIHDRAYEKALRESFKKYGDLTDKSIIAFQLDAARERFRLHISRHVDVADCMILYEIGEEIT